MEDEEVPLVDGVFEGALGALGMMVEYLVSGSLEASGFDGCMGFIGGGMDEEYGELGFNPLVHSFCALSTLRRSGLRTASAAAKPCQGDSLEFYLITGRIPTVAAAGQRHVNSQPHAHTSYS
ncbi:hypothetical protein Tco_0948583 [Tanacetum coccineum]